MHELDASLSGPLHTKKRPGSNVAVGTLETGTYFYTYKVLEYCGFYYCVTPTRAFSLAKNVQTGRDSVDAALPGR